MAHKQVFFRSEARDRVLRGATQLTDAVRVTLGPRSKSVLIEKHYGAPLVCNDGVTIAKEFDLKDPEENLGARMLRQAAEKTGDMVGDGTSTATILAHAIFADGVRNVVAGASAIDIKRGLDRATKRAVAALKALSPDGAPIAWFPPRVKTFFANQQIDKASARLESTIAFKQPELSHWAKYNWLIELPQADYSTLGKAVAGLENAEPLLSIVKISIKALPEDPQFQQVTLNASTAMVKR